MSIIEFKHVTKYFKKRKVIDDLSFSLASQEVVALVGTNGAGKTTTIRMILGLSQPDQGEIIRKSEDFNSKIGVQLQATPFFEGYTVEDNLKLFSTFHNVKITNKKIEEVLKKYSLLEVKLVFASKLSLGQQKRLALCIATIHEPELVILDEPSAGLDPSGQRDIQQLIQQLKNQGKTVLFTSHDMQEVRNTADKIMIMDHGVLIEEGSPESLIEKYAEQHLDDVFYKLTRKEEADA